MEKLPVSDILMEGMKLPIRKAPYVLKRVGIPFACLILFSWAVMIYAGEHEVLSGILHLVATAGIYAIAAVSCHRIFLLEQKDIENTPVFYFGRREVKFLLYLAGIGILAGLVAIPFTMLLVYLIPHIIPCSGCEQKYLVALATLGASIPAYYFMARLSLTLPAIATNQDTNEDWGYSWAWNISCGNEWRLFLILGILPIALNGLFDLVFADANDSTMLSLLGLVIWMPVAVTEICFLSLSYRWLRAHDPWVEQAKVS